MNWRRLDLNLLVVFDAVAFKAPLQVPTLPFPSPTLPFAMLWHRRQEDHAAHRWLRGVVSRVARTL